ncbi:unnamed protein product [Cyclocybe aegerita]|uniref:Prolyl 4-hydroxylase alpha subunit Fe(2+) 2OG dioxygenase domain-containing protein n=1 Tax=Cyclocybe aegerita TaxID=1973307 RepID=A0A8S0WR99_CYCAE|nr:unnamed protein product [Cyclocybe aegerita]
MSSTLETVQAMLQSVTGLPYCTGTVPLDATNSTLFYRSGDLKADHFSPLQLGIIKSIVESLFHGQREATDTRVELYKLNVYGLGAFFKAHVDTLRSDKMFGSLVVVLPTAHTGGSLIFRHQGNEWTFDSAKAVNEESTPYAAFVAFFSDVEHEV